MLTSAGSPMHGLFLLAAHMPAHRVKRVLILTVFACAGTTPLLHSQAPAPTSYQIQSDPAKSPQWNRSMLDPFLSGSNFGKFAGTAAGGMGFIGDAGAFAIDRQGFGAGKLGPGGFNRFASASMVGNSDDLAPLFSIGSFKPDRSTGTDGHFGPASATLPSLNQIMRRSSSLPLNPSLGALRLSYQDTFRPIGNLGDLGLPSASALFSSPDLGNGVFLSAGTGYGMRPAAGAPAAAIGNSTSGGPKHSSPLVNLKLSF